MWKKNFFVENGLHPNRRSREWECILKTVLGPNEHLMDILELAYDDSRLPDEINRYFNVIWFYAIWLVEIIVKENDSGHVKWAKRKITVPIRFFLELCLLDLPDLILLLQSRDTLIGQIRLGIPEYHQSFQISLYSLTSIAL